PRCNAPIVGTKPILRADSSASRTSLTLWTARTYLLDVRARCCENLLAQMRVQLCKRRGGIGEAQRVKTDQDLPVAVSSGADSDRRNLQRRARPRRKV